jgi:cell division protein FtsI/penicillin-binding protein 2
VGGAVLARLFSLQVVRGESYSDQADSSYVRSSDTFDRGAIYFSKKDGSHISAATVNTGYILAINPNLLENPGDAFTKISSIIDIDEAEFTEKAAKENDPYEEIANQISRENADAISALKLTGVTMSKHKWRFYPGREMSAQTIGFMGYGADNIVSGQYGLEKYYNETLTKDEENLYVNIFAEIFSGVKAVVFEGDERTGDIVTTIEPTVQNSLEKELVAVTEKYHPESASGIIMSPQTGEIYAMASFPNFDLNEFGGVSDPSIYSNPLVENVYEFGSVVKPLVLAAGIDLGVISASTPFYDKGSVRIEDKEIFNFDKKGRGQITMQDVLSESLNTGMVYSMQKIGRNKFKEYMEGFRLGEKTNIDLPNEAKGLTGNLDEPRELEYANISFGQGISFSPIVLIRAIASLGNGGYIVRPHVVKEIEYEEGGEKAFEYLKEDQPTIIKPETSRAISDMLVYSVDHIYGNGKYKMENYSIAAKTGTAQIPNPADGGYFTDRNLHSFVGYFPASDPQFVIFLSITAPKGVKYAAETLSVPFFDTTKFLINYYEVAPDR